MKKLLVRGLYCGLVLGGLSLLGTGIAQAAETTGDDGLLSGNQLGLSLNLPITVAGNGISVLGNSTSGSATTVVEQPGAPSDLGAATTSGESAVAAGTQTLIDIAVPITVGGNAISVLGDSNSNDAITEIAGSDDAATEAANPTTVPTTSGAGSLIGGTQALLDIGVPITVGGNAISVLGDSNSSGATTEIAGDGAGDESAMNSSLAPSTSGADSTAGGNQVLPGISIPVTLTGNAVSVIGDSRTEDSSGQVGHGAPAAGGGGLLGATVGDSSVLGGNQIVPGIALPVTIGGNAVSVLGESTATGARTHVAPTVPVTPAVPVTPSTPSTPVTPTVPANPTVPTTPAGLDDPTAAPAPAAPSGTGRATASSPSAAAVHAVALARTGSDAPALMGVAALALLAGALLTGIRRLRGMNMRQ